MGTKGTLGTPVDLSQMSPEERARLSALIEVDGDADLRVHLLGAIGRSQPVRRSSERTRELPPQWTQIHVLDRLEEAFEVLAALPARTRPKQYGNAMPTPMQEKLTNKDWIDLLETGEIDTVVEARHRVRLAPTTAQITRMEQASRWPFDYLRDRPELAKAISLRAMWAVMQVDIRKRCAARKIDHDDFNKQWQEGLRIITGRLIANRVAVS